MGNIGSQSGQLSPPQAVGVAEEHLQWAHSFPRTQTRLCQQHKVLPDRDARQRLRATDNGEILHAGGTISGRGHQRTSVEKEQDDSHNNCRPRSPKTKTYLPNQRDPLHKSGARYTQAFTNNKLSNGFTPTFKDQIKRFGSEPDLRYSIRNDNIQMRDRSRTKKKYKAPPPPPNHSMINWDHNLDSEIGSPIRRARLFKTRAETKKNISSPISKHKFEHSDHEVKLRKKQDIRELRNNRLSLPELKMVPTTKDFQEELKEATKRLRNAKLRDTNNISLEVQTNNADKLKTLDPNITNRENIRKKLREFTEESKIPHTLDCIRGEGSGKESTTPEQSPPPRKNREKDPTPKPFYFGMDQQNPLSDIVDNFASDLHLNSKVRRHSSGSDMSSEIELDENQHLRNGIDLQLRPMLPKKQLEIPRFSPLAAWRLLSAVDANPEASTIGSEDVPLFIEDRIEKFARRLPPPTLHAGPRSSNDKSGDSGISGDAGDAGPAGFDETGEGMLHPRNNIQASMPFSRSTGLSWTPQQDLGDDSSLEEGINIQDSNYNQQKYSNKPHVFSLSLPRDNHLAAYMIDKQLLPYTGIQKIKRSFSGVLSNLSSNKKLANSNQDQSENWFFSKSAPNSLNNGFNSLDIKLSQKSDDIDQSLVPTTKHNSGRLMYLPESGYQEQRQSRSRTKDDYNDRSKSAERAKADYKLSVFSKSCENISTDLRSSSEPEDLQDPPRNNKDDWRAYKKPKRFTFQSTIRQIERKRLAEKLSREAERKEMQRLRELEAMQKVEEEFQKKRAREKANIRQQLRLYSMDDNEWSSEVDKEKVPARPEPDGAVSSSSSPSLPLPKSPPCTKRFQKNKKSSEIPSKYRASSESSEDNRKRAPATQVLSEYRQHQREYKEYRGSTKYLNEVNDNHNKQTTVHPKVICNMPKAKGQQQGSNNKNGLNYRKDFAHGVKSTRSAGSTYSDDSQPRNYSPRVYHSKHAPITRF